MSGTVDDLCAHRPRDGEYVHTVLMFLFPLEAILVKEPRWGTVDVER